MSLERERATLDYDPRVLTVAQMVEAIGRTVALPGVRQAIERIIRPRGARTAR